MSPERRDSSPCKLPPSAFTTRSTLTASHVVKDLLDSGYKVRGTVRSNEKGDYLKDLFKGKDFDYVIADDITKVSLVSS